MKREDHWPIDGHDHHVIARNAIYENGKISSFLDSNRINLVIASKRMGKTLLMRVKKMVIDSDDDALLIPKNAAKKLAKSICGNAAINFARDFPLDA